MNILYYIPNLSKTQGGIYQYSKRVLDALIETEHNIFIWNENSDFDEYGILDKVRVVRSDFGVIDKLRYKITRVLRALSQEFSSFKGVKLYSPDKKLCIKFKIDLVHSPHQGIPIFPTPFIFTLHDVQELHFPEYFSPLERELRARNNRIACESAKAVVVSYEHVKQDLVNYFGLDSATIYVLFIGTSDNSLLPRKFAPKLELNESPFLLYPAATWPHKNHLNLLRAFKMVLDKGFREKKLKLICTGHKTEHFNIIQSTMKDLQLEGAVEFLGVVSDADLKELYKNCLGVVVPTKYEAGSFPLMESMAQTIPVICSNVTSLPETIHNPKFVFSPEDIEELSALMIKLVADHEFIAENIQNSIEQRASIVDQPLTKKLEDVLNEVSS